MSLPPTPAFFTAFVTFSIAAPAAESAWLAVSPRASTPKVNVASSGVVVTVAEPLTVMERIGPALSGSVSADRTKSGRPTPARAAATSTSRATAAIRTGRMASSVDVGPRTYAAGHAGCHIALGRCPGEAEVRAPAVRDLRRGQMDEEHRCRRARRRAELHPRLLERTVALPVIARRTRGDDVLPHRLTAAAARHDVVERQPPVPVAAVDAAPAVPGEQRPARDLPLHGTRHANVGHEPDHVRPGE